MPKKLLLKVSVLIVVFIMSLVVYNLLQDPEVYNNTLAKISSNYQRVGTAKRYTIKKVKEPFLEITEDNAYHWDAFFYLTIRDKSYNEIDPHYPDRYAFYPFFSYIWKISGIRSYHIIILNYLFFGLGIILLSQLLMKDKPDNMFFFMLAVLLPTSIVFYLPYAESLFVLTMAIGLAGLFRRSYLIYFIAMVCFSMTRPAVVILLFAFIGADIIYFLRHRNFRHFLKQSLLTISPVIAGWVIVTVIQYFYSGTWTAYFDTWELWPKESGFFNKITDWSTEGFGMNTFAIFFLALPSLIYAVVWAISSVFSMRRKEKAEVVSLFAGNETYIKNYMFNVSALFMVGVILYFIVTSGNVINGFFRYTMNVPFFFILFFLLPEKLKEVPVKYKAVAFLLIIACLVSFLLTVHYAGNLKRFDYMGLYLLIPIAAVAIFENYIPAKIKIIIPLVFILPCIVWYTYLFNMYLSNAWIFT